MGVNLKEKTVVLTGAAGCLGQIIGATLEEQGCQIAAWDINAQALQDVQKKHPKWLITSCDLTCDTQVAQATKSVIERFGSVDVLINNAGLIYSRPLFNLMGGAERRHSIESWRQTIDANLTSTFITSSHIVEHMILKRTQGVIINISSIAAEGNTGQSAYSAAKAGVNALTQTWAKELGPMGIRVVAIAPGFVDTPSTHRSMSETILNSWVNKTALRRLVQPQSVAQTIISVLSNDDLTGLVLPVNAGLNL